GIRGRRGGGVRARCDPAAGARRPPARGGAPRGSRRLQMKIELRGLELFGYHGVHEYERERGQRFLYDVELEVGERGADDLIESAGDYSRAAARVRGAAAGPHRLLESLAARLAETIDERFEPAWVRVRVRKPDVRPAGIDVEFAAVTAER